VGFLVSKAISLTVFNRSHKRKALWIEHSQVLWYPPPHFSPGKTLGNEFVNSLFKTNYMFQEDIITKINVDVWYPTKMTIQEIIINWNLEC